MVKKTWNANMPIELINSDIMGNVENGCKFNGRKLNMDEVLGLKN